ncbi:MAG: hypothetical protein ACYDCI_10815 [Candidatus Limnocylindrales bacterium]
MMLLEAEVTEHVVLADCSRSVDWAGFDALSTILDDTLADIWLESDGKIEEVRSTRQRPEGREPLLHRTATQRRAGGEG